MRSGPEPHTYMLGGARDIRAILSEVEASADAGYTNDTNDANVDTTEDTCECAARCSPGQRQSACGVFAAREA